MVASLLQLAGLAVLVAAAAIIHPIAGLAGLGVVLLLVGLQLEPRRRR